MVIDLIMTYIILRVIKYLSFIAYTLNKMATFKIKFYFFLSYTNSNNNKSNLNKINQ